MMVPFSYMAQHVDAEYMDPIRVMIVECDASAAADLENQLDRLGYEVAGIVSTYTGALTQVGAHAPDLVLIDIDLQGEMDGIATAEQIRAQFHLPVVYVTARTDEPTIERVKSAPPADLILRPFDDRMLHFVVQTALSRHKVENNLRESERHLLQQEREQRLRSETLAEVTMALASQTHYGKVMEEILRQAQRIVPHTTANVAVLEGDNLRIVHWRGYGERAPEWEKWAPNRVQALAVWSLDREAIETRTPALAADTHREPRWKHLEATAWIRSYLSVPICLRDQVLGLLRLDSEKPDQFSAEDGRRLAPLASAAAIAIENARLFSEERRRVDELETLRHVSLQVTSMLDLRSVLESIADGALNLVGATACHIHLRDPASGGFIFGTALWEEGRQAPPLVQPREDGFTALVAREGRTIVLNDALAHPLFADIEAPHWRVHAIAGVPLKHGSEIVGVFSVAFLEPHTFSEDELRVLDLLADQAVIAVQNARLVEDLEAKVAARTAEIVAEKETSEALLRSVGDAITMTDPDLRIRYVNPAFMALTGYTREELVGQLASIAGAGADDGELGHTIVQHVAAEGIWHGEVRARRKDGRTYDAALTVAPVRDAQGELLGYVSSHRDISRAKELERARTQFITNVSHQLRTPATNMKLYTRLLRGGLHTAKAGAYLRVLEQQADTLTHLIQDILEIVALDGGQAVIDWEPISLSGLMDEALERYREEARAKGLVLEAAVGADAPETVMGDEPRLVQALGELIENGVHFTPAGGWVMLRAGSVERDVRRWATIAVHDSGPGVPQAEQERIFERFFRGHLAEAGDIPGTGLGLSIAQQIAQAHGGRVTVESGRSDWQSDQPRPGGGSVFTLWLPLS
jgi:PAS domain S-box-containing protein